MAKANKVTKIGDLRSKSESELHTRLGELRKEQLNLRIQKATGQLTNVARITQVRKEVAQIQTLINEQKRGGGSPAKKPAKKKAA
jgi:large subunit ribosomal protein L29